MYMIFAACTHTHTHTHTRARARARGTSPIALFEGLVLSAQKWTPEKSQGGDEVILNVLRCQLTYLGQAVTNAEAWFSIALRSRKPESSLGRTAQDGHLDSHTAPELSDSGRAQSLAHNGYPSSW